MKIYQPSRLPPASNFRVCERERHEECAGLIFQSERATESERLKKKRLAAVQHFHSVHP